MSWKKISHTLRRIWHFIWEEDSIWSWIVNIGLAFLLIKFLVYPGLGFVLNTSHPIVAVVSGSMEHDGNFEQWWPNAGSWYEEVNITKEDFNRFTMRNGFNKGDIMILHGKKPQDIKIGDIVVFKSGRPDPIIHRVVVKWQENGDWYFQTKGDNYKTNPTSIRSFSLDETRISEGQLIGVAAVKVPLLGWIKIMFMELIQLFVS